MSEKASYKTATICMDKNRYGFWCKKKSDRSNHSARLKTLRDRLNKHAPIHKGQITPIKSPRYLSGIASYPGTLVLGLVAYTRFLWPNIHYLYRFQVYKWQETRMLNPVAAHTVC